MRSYQKETEQMLGLMYWIQSKNLEWDAKKLEKLLQQAQAHRSQEYEAKIRQQLILYYKDLGYHDKLLQQYAWLGGYWELNPEQTWDSYEVRFYNRAVEAAICFPQISKTKVLDLLQDFEKKWQQKGHSQKGIYHVKALIYQMLEDNEQGEYYRTQAEAEMGSGTGCCDCQNQQQIQWFFIAERYAEGLAIAREMLQKGSVCGVAMHQFLRASLYAHWLGKPEEAEQFYYFGLKQTPDKERGPYLAQMVDCMSATHNYELALSLLEEALRKIWKQASPYQQWEIAQAATDLFRGMQTAGLSRAKLSLPNTIAFAKLGRVFYPTEVLKVYFTEIMQNMMTAFDQRNGNSAYQTRRKIREQTWATLPALAMTGEPPAQKIEDIFFND